MERRALRRAGAMAVLAAATLAGCSTARELPLPDGTITRQPDAGAPVERVARIDMRLTDEARALVAKNPGFEPAALQKTVEQEFVERDLLDGGAASTLEIEVFDLRARSEAEQFQLDQFLSGDRIGARVAHKHADGRITRRFEVISAFAGSPGPFKDRWMTGLYTSFARKTADAFVAPPD